MIGSSTESKSTTQEKNGISMKKKAILLGFIILGFLIFRKPVERQAERKMETATMSVIQATTEPIKGYLNVDEISEPVVSPGLVTTGAIQLVEEIPAKLITSSGPVTVQFRITPSFSDEQPVIPQSTNNNSVR